MSRPVAADADRTKKRLIGVANRHFSLKGSTNTSLREVARDAGVSLATISHYFGTKQQLEQACMATSYSEMTAAMEPMARLLAQLSEGVRGASAEELKVTVEDLARSAFRILTSHRQELRMIMRPWWETGRLDERWKRESHLPFLRTASEAISAATGRPTAEIRLEVQSLVIIAMKYALTDPRELAEQAGVVLEGPIEDSQADEALDLVAEHLATMSINTLFPERTDAKPEDP